MKRLFSITILLAFGLQIPLIYSANEVYSFENNLQRQQFQQLSQELRCVVCQNQNLADSNAQLAKDLKDIIAKQTLEGKDPEQIIEFMVARYGEFVLYKPPFKVTTWLLWLGPFLLLIVIITGLLFWQRQSRCIQPTQDIDNDSLEKARGLLQDQDKETDNPHL